MRARVEHPVRQLVAIEQRPEPVAIETHEHRQRVVCSAASEEGRRDVEEELAKVLERALRIGGNLGEEGLEVLLGKTGSVGHLRHAGDVRLEKR